MEETQQNCVRGCKEKFSKQFVIAAGFDSEGKNKA